MAPTASAPSGKGAGAATPARERPDPRPARLMMGAGALAAVTVIGAGLVDFPAAVAEQPSAAALEAPVAQTRRLEQEVRYVRLKPGQKAPKGAKVIREAAPKPRIVVRRVVVPGPRTASAVVARSRQSGR